MARGRVSSRAMPIRASLIPTLLASTLALVACDKAKSEDGSKADSKGDAKAAEAGEAKADTGAAAASAKLFPEEMRKKPCDLLKPEMVAKVAGVAADKLEKMEIVGMCNYSWEGGQASLGMIDTSETAEQRRKGFELAYRNMSGEEVAEAMDKIGEMAKDQIKADNEDKAEGEKVDHDHVDPVAMGISGALAGGISYKPIEGLAGADAAVYETTKTSTTIAGMKIEAYANTMVVLVGNMSFNLGFSLEEAQGSEAKMYETENVELAKQVLAGPVFQ